jgi:hypothetical protein
VAGAPESQVASRSRLGPPLSPSSIGPSPRAAASEPRSHQSKRKVSDFCVILGAERLNPPLEDGVIATREILAKLFPTKQNDRFDVRGRFEQPRPDHECVVFVRHEDGIEEIHVSLESVEAVPYGDA